MAEVGVRELKNRLSHYLREVRAGKTILVTDRGEVVAEIRTPTPAAGPLAAYPGLAALADHGVLDLGSPARPDLYPRLPPVRAARPTSAELLDEERGDR
jgi:antitoxin (DNA-binding transcriptional repressor) of toxin-antitoxin stability system